MEFKVKDLMVNLLQDRTADGCHTTCGKTGPVTNIICGFLGLPTYHNGPNEYTTEQSFVALTILKGQLKEQLVDVEKEEKALEGKMTPDELGHAVALSKRLEIALDEVQEVLDELAKTAPEEKSDEG